MKISDLLLTSLSNLWKRKLRTVLTVLGVVIGVTSIVVMMSLGNGLKETMMEQISSYGSLTQIQVRSNSDYYGSGSNTDQHFLDDALVNEILHMDHVEAVYPKLYTDVIIKTGKYETNVQLYGMTEEGLRETIKLGEGEYPQNSGNVELLFGNCVPMYFYNTKTHEYEYWDKGVVPDINFLEDTFFVIYDLQNYSEGGNSVTENGETQKKAQKFKTSSVGVVEGDIEDWNVNAYNVYTEIESLKKQLKKVYKNRAIPGQPTRKNGKPYKEIYYSELIVQMDDISNVEGLTKTLNDLGYSAYNDAEWIQSEQKQLNMIQAVLGAIGAVSLLVAAIGITNTMMMSIYERTKEIGVMKVLGCDIRNIQILFLTEAGFIGFIGGVIGLGFSAGINVMINMLVNGSEMGLTKICVMPIWLPVVAIAFAILIGMFAGFLPSLRAMRLSPLAAIRNE